ncbi:MAG: DNA-directed RNA polymerase subunit omega [Vicinamibacterales bacterium]
MDTNALTETGLENDGVDAPLPKAPPIESRFLFVDVAAMRAKQLRRGAKERLRDDDEGAAGRPKPHKPERVAMEEVRRGLVLYDVPPTTGPIDTNA